MKMNRLCYFLVIVLFVSALRSVQAEAPRPNILFFYVDDMGWGSIGPNGQAARRKQNLPSVRTPNLDRLAAEGVNFRRGYGCHVCSPARSSLQTGFHQGHTFADRNDPNNARKAIRADDPSIGKSLLKAGYATGYWGKWGYGGSKDMQNPVIENVQTLPTSHGFQHVLAELHHVRAHTFFQPTLWNAPSKTEAAGGLELIPNSVAKYKDGKSYPQTPALQSHAEYPSTGYCDDSYAFAALDFVRTQGQNYNKTGQPFLGLLAVQIPHAPFADVATLPEWSRAYKDDPHFKSLSPQSQQWAAMVTRIDAHFGNILAALEDPNNDGDTSDSIAENTLVIFQSDNGGPAGRNNVEFNANGGLSGNKGKIQEGGIRVPLVMRWPAKINADSKLKAGSNCDTVVDVTDLFPTFCELAGSPMPLGIDGVSIAPLLTGQGRQRQREFIIHEAGNGQSIIRDNMKLVRSRNNAVALYDLAVDPGESSNIAAKHPRVVKQLKTLLLAERVTEPKGFANTYHHWLGEDGARTSDAANWSNYKYANAGVTYMEDAGAPQLSWIAKIQNRTAEPRIAQVDADLELLALEVRGAGAKATQSLRLGEDVNLTGRNEIRLSPHSSLTINGGKVTSLRWVDLAPGSSMAGHGAVDADVFNHGIIAATGSDTALAFARDYHQSATGVLRITLSKAGHTPLVVAGNAVVDGQLQIAVDRSFKPARGVPVTVLTSSGLKGRFANPESEVVAKDGSRFAIGYSKTAVTLTLK